ncbi:sensor histidine kinase [Flexivirga alba]|uniref:histidine kinase n=1 Tax=Flexivirga alba TaxID=702742 RepID=A0ABW2AI01_9MICO
MAPSGGTPRRSVLRPEGGSAATSPQPGLPDLPALAASYRSAGLCVACTSTVTGRLPGSVELTAYRVAQEALTNVLRHSQSGDARHDVRRLGDSLRVEITDLGPPRPGTEPPGHGLAGMTERVAACGGRLDAGPLGAGFRVAATLPLAVAA